MNKIDRLRFNFVFKQMDWIHSESDSKKYDIWTNPLDHNLWGLIPKDDSSPEYEYCENKNIEILLNTFHLEKNEFNVNDIKSQLLGYNYKLINRIETSENNDSIPYEFSQVLPQKNIDAFRYYYSSNGGKNKLSIEDFHLNHTYHGSFIIPISIAVTQNNSAITLCTVASDMNRKLHEYLIKVNELSELPIENEEKFIKLAFEKQLDSKLVREFLSISDSVAKCREKYTNSIRTFSISGNSSHFLDYHLSVEEKKFPVVDLTHMKSIPDMFISGLEKLEIKEDNTAISDVNASIKVFIDSLSYEGTVKFSVININGKEVHKPFKAWSVKLSKSKLDLCTDAFKTRDSLIIKGDISKQKGKAGEILIDDLIEDVEQRLL